MKRYTAVILDGAFNDETTIPLHIRCILLELSAARIYFRLLPDASVISAESKHRTFTFIDGFCRKKQRLFKKNNFFSSSYVRKC